MRLHSLVVLLLLLPVAGFGQALPALIPITNGEEWGYADTTGKVVIPLQWAEAGFFVESKAMVTTQKGSGSTPAQYALIDAQGRYLVPPAAGWNGLWQGGWGGMSLNAVDSAGRWGLVDTAGRVLIPYEWDNNSRPMEGALQDSFKMVHRNGLWGILNRQGQLVVSPKWSEIKSSPELSKLRAFEVRDPDNGPGVNSLGIANLEDRILVPPRYSSIQVQNTKGGNLVFQASRGAENQRKNGSYGPAAVAPAVRFLSYPEGRILPLSESGLLLKDPYEVRLPGGFIFSSQQRELLDSDRKVVVPCCNFWKLEGDTLFLREEKRIGKDSVLLTVTFKSLSTGQILMPAYQDVLYAPEPVRYDRSAVFEGHSYNYQEPQHYKIPLPYWGEVEYFYKDSLLYQVIGKTLTSTPDYIVRGTVGKEYPNYYAVVNARREYLLPPQRRWKIESYNAGTGLAIATGHETGTSTSVYTLLDAAGNSQMQPQQGKIEAGFIWHRAVYGILQTRDVCDPDAPAQFFVINSAGVAVPAFRNWKVQPYLSQPSYYFDHSAMPYEERYPPAEVWVLDSAGRLGIFRPDGQPAYPALTFKYRQLSRTRNGWFLAGTTERGSKILVDSTNKNLLPQLECASLEPTQNSFLKAADYRSFQVVPRIFKAFVKSGTAGKAFPVYLDDRGRLYYTAP